MRAPARSGLDHTATVGKVFQDETRARSSQDAEIEMKVIAIPWEPIILRRMPAPSTESFVRFNMATNEGYGRLLPKETVASEFLRARRTFRVYLPASYESARRRRY